VFHEWLQSPSATGSPWHPAYVMHAMHAVIGLISQFVDFPTNDSLPSNVYSTADYNTHASYVVNQTSLSLV